MTRDASHQPLLSKVPWKIRMIHLQIRQNMLNKQMIQKKSQLSHRQANQLNLRHHSLLPRLVWVSYNGYMYRCSPEGLRPLPEDEAAFRELSKELAVGQLAPDMERADNQLG